MTEPATDFDPSPHVEALHRDGYSLLPGFLGAEALDRLRVGLAPHIGSHSGRNDFEGLDTERVYTLIARARVFADLAEDARILAILDRVLQPGYLLTASQAINIRPGETAQPLHTDDAFYRIPRPRPAISYSMILAIDDFTTENGATEVIPGSHLWAMSGAANGFDLSGPPPEPVIMAAGSCIVFSGCLVHRGGGNRSARDRLAITMQYCEPWARPQENYFLAIPPERVRALSPRMRQLLGYSIWPPFMGHVTASHPLKTLEPDYVLPMSREPWSELPLWD